MALMGPGGTVSGAINRNPLGLSGNRLNAFRQANPGLGNVDAATGYNGAIPEQLSNYDEIMGGYRKLLGGGDDGGYGDLINKYQTAIGSGQPSDVQYQQAPEWSESYGLLKGLAKDGGLNEADRYNLRERGMSPIRAVYANAKRNLDRQRSLSGGGSANFAAAQSKMAREQSEKVAQSTTDVNARIAEMVQSGKLAATPKLADMASGKNDLMNKVALQNQANKADWQKTQASLLSGLGGAIGDRNNIPLKALQGMTDLYGTNPALVRTMGNEMRANQRPEGSRIGGR